ncbi:MAG: DnaJ domain-containing protein [Acidobacteria bacterium]|nr:DnaJ domain-containing protein [Acidobacteriota bacterium]
MGDPSPACEALPLLGEVYRNKKTGILSVGSGSGTLRVVVKDGQIVGICPDPAPEPAPGEAMPGPEDSARLKLDRILAEVGLRRPPAWPARVDEPPDMGDPRDRLVEALSETAATATFEPTADVPEDAIPTAGATEPLILEALRGLEADAIREMLGNPDQRLVTTTVFTEEQRTLTLTEGYLLSRIDGQTSAREILQLVPMEPDDAERTLAGLVLTGRVTRQPGPAPVSRPTRPRPTVKHAAQPAPAETSASEEPEAEPVPEEPEAEPVPEELKAEPAPAAPSPDVPPAAQAESTPPADSEADANALDEPLPMEIPFDEPEPEGLPEELPEELTEEQRTERREILEFFQSLPTRNHFQVLGLDRECTAAELKRAHVGLVKRYHPDMRRDAHLQDLHDVLEAIFIRVGEAWEVLGNEKSRAAYESRLGPLVRPPTEAEPPSTAEPTPDEPPPASEDEAAVSPEETLHQARELLGQAKYWDAIQMLESAVPQIRQQRHQHRGRILLAQAYAQNPKWVHRAVETLQEVVSEDPANADAHYQLGRLYKAGGLAARSQAAFRKVLELQPGHKQAAAQLEGESGTGGGLLRRLFGGGDKSA